MSGTRLALGTVAALAAAGLVRRRGRGAGNRGLTVTREGWPWPANYPIYHATMGLRSILSDRFRVRRQGLGAATGGGTDEAVSFTLSPGIARAIVVGLVTLRAGARRELLLEDLWRRFAAECPSGTAELRRAGDAEHDPARHRLLDQGLLEERPGFGGRLPPGAIPIGQGWMGRDHRYYHGWWRKPETQAEQQEVDERRDRAFLGLYNALTAYGGNRKECYYPSFWGTDLPGLAKLDIEDIGIIEARSRVPRIILSPMNAVKFGYLERPAAHLYEGFLGRISRDTTDRLDHHTTRLERGWSDRGPEPMFASYGYPTDKQIGPWRLVDEGDARPDTTMSSEGAMFELRIYDPAKIAINEAWSSSEILHLWALTGRVSAPWVSDVELDRRLPGQIVLGALS